MGYYELEIENETENTISFNAADSRKEEEAMKKSYKIDVDCAACAENMEAAAKKTPGVKDCTVAFMTLKMKVEFEEGADAAAVMQQVRANCKKVESDCEVYI